MYVYIHKYIYIYIYTYVYTHIQTLPPLPSRGVYARRSACFRVVFSTWRRECTSHGGEQTSNMWISRFACFPGHLCEWRGLPFTPVKKSLKILGLPWKFVWKSRGLLWNLAEILAVVVMISPISYVCGDGEFVSQDSSCCHACLSLKTWSLHVLQEQFRNSAISSLDHDRMGLGRMVEDNFRPQNAYLKQVQPCISAKEGW